MKILSKSPDGGEKSGVTGYFLIEIKSLFSIVLLRFSKGSREAFHSHAFNAITFWLKGDVEEIDYPSTDSRDFSGPSIIPKITKRNKYHKIYARKTTWALSFRGPWSNTWKEYRPSLRREVVLTHGRKEVIV